MLILVIALSVVLASAGGVAVLSRRHGWRWGEVGGPSVRAGAGAYREATVATTLPRRVPRRVQWAAGTGFIWGVMTFLIFAPAGLLLVFLLSGENPLGMLGVLAVSLSGFALGVMLAKSGGDLLRCRADAHARANRIATWSLVHHVAVFVLMTLLAEGDIERAGAVAIPCAIGLAHALLLLSASRAPAPAVPQDPPTS